VTGFAWRALVSPWLAVLAVLLEAWSALEQSADWRGDLVWTLGEPVTPLLILGPLLAGTVAVDTARLTSAAYVGLWAGSRPRSRKYVFPLAAGVVPVAGGVLAVSAVLVGITARRGLDFPVSPGDLLQPFVVVLALGAFGALGSLVGRVLPVVPAGLAAAAASFALTQIGATRGEPTFEPFSMSAAQSSSLGLTYGTRYAVAQVVLFCLVIVVALAAPVRLRGSLRIPTAAGWGALVVVACLVTLSSGAIGSPQYVPSAAEPTDCGGVAVDFCTFTEHDRERRLDEPTIEALVAAAREHGYSALAATDVVEVITKPQGLALATGAPLPAAQVVPAHELTYSFDGYSPVYRGHRTPAFSVASSLVYPYQCPQVYSEAGPPDSFYDNLNRVAATWAGLIGVSSADNLMVRNKTPLTPAQVATIMEQLRSCSF
jgi:hypothetical protein